MARPLEHIVLKQDSTEFQKAMDRTLLNVLNTFCFLDDILIVTVGSVAKHNEMVEEVMKLVDAQGFSLKLKKCDFSVKEIEWLGYEINATGVKPKRSKVEDIMNLKPPKTLSQLRSFVGSINHLGSFLEGAEKLTAKFKDSLSKGNKLKFYWTAVQTEAFYALIDLVAKITQNYHYNPNLKTRLKCDASKLGLGTSLEQEFEPNVWKPIAFASRQLNSQEAKYSTSE